MKVEVEFSRPFIEVMRRCRSMIVFHIEIGFSQLHLLALTRYIAQMSAKCHLFQPLLSQILFFFTQNSTLNRVKTLITVKQPYSLDEIKIIISILISHSFFPTRNSPNSDHSETIIA